MALGMCMSIFQIVYIRILFAQSFLIRTDGKQALIIVDGLCIAAHFDPFRLIINRGDISLDHLDVGFVKEILLNQICFIGVDLAHLARQDVCVFEGTVGTLWD